MDLNKKLEPYFPLIEKVLIALIFLATLLSYMMADTGSFFSDTIVGLQIGLIMLYFMQLQVKPYALIWAGFLLAIIAYFFGEELGPTVHFIFHVASYVAFGIIVLFKSIKASIKNKAFEMLNFIMGALMILQLALPLFPKKDEVLTAYAFAFSFTIGTIMYNDNLWHRYNSDEKNIIKYILILALVMVLRISFKHLSF